MSAVDSERDDGRTAAIGRPSALRLSQPSQQISSLPPAIDSTSSFWTKACLNSTFLDNDVHFLDSHLCGSALEYNQGV